MLAKKTRITLIVAAIVATIILIVGIVMFLYLKTDIFKSNEDLFFKYFTTGFDALDIIKVEDNLGIETNLNANKYTSNLQGKIEYTTNVGTDNEDKNSGINQIVLNVKSNIDKANNYKYQNILLGTENNNYVGIEYLQDKDNYGARLQDIQQFVSGNDSEQKILSDIGIQDISIITKDIDINSIFNFSDEEKQTLINTYSNIIKSNVSKDKYNKQINTLITMDNGDIQTNSYYIKMQLEDYNNLVVKLLQQAQKDEIILSRLDKLEEAIKTKYPEYNPDQSIKEKFVSEINSRIENIQNNNIGNEEVKVSVYENSGKAVRISSERAEEKIIIDNNNNKLKISISELNTDTIEKTIKFEKNNTDTENKQKFEYENKKNDSIQKAIEVELDNTLKDDKIERNLKISLQNKTYQGILTLDDQIQTVDKFDNQVTFEKDNIVLSTLQDEQKNAIMEILKENIQNQFNNLYSIASKDDYTKMLQNLGIIKKGTIQISSDGGVTETEKKRFNSQFEFFASENLSKDNIKELIEASENNLQDIKILLKTGETDDIDINKLKESSSESGEYKKNIAGIVIYIKPNATNEKVESDALEYIDKYASNDKYAVTIQYDNNGITKAISAKFQTDDNND